MSIKTIIQKWLGIEPPKQRISAARAYQAPMQNTYQPTLQRLPFEKVPSKMQSKKKERDWSHKSMKKSVYAPKTAREMYEACGGYQMFRKIAMHPNWYKVEKRGKGEDRGYTLRVYNHSALSNKKKPESKIMHVASQKQGEDVAMQLMEIHITEISKQKSY